MILKQSQHFNFIMKQTHYEKFTNIKESASGQFINAKAKVIPFTVLMLQYKEGGINMFFRF